MNKGIVWNIVLGVAVVTLFVLHFIGGNPTGNTKPSNNLPSAKVAYVNVDSLNKKITFIKNTLEQLEAEQTAIQKNYESGMQDLQNQNESFAKKAQGLGQDEIAAFQEKLYMEKAKLDNTKDTALEKLNEKSTKFFEEYHTQLKEQIARFNKTAGYGTVLSIGKGFDFILYGDTTHDITSAIIKNMNEVYSKK